MEIVAETERLLLRRFEKSDLKAALRFWGNPEVMIHSGGAAPREKLPDILKAYQKTHDEKELSVYAVM